MEAGRGRPQAEPIPEAEESLRPRPGLAGTSGSAAPASPDLGPRGLDLASLQAEREVVRGAGLGRGGGLAVDVSRLPGGGWCQTSGGVAGGDRSRGTGTGIRGFGLAWEDVRVLGLSKGFAWGDEGPGLRIPESHASPVLSPRTS